MRKVRLRDSTTQGRAGGEKGHTKAPHNTGRVGESDHDRRGITCELSAVQRAKMSIMVRPTTIPTMPTTMLEVFTGRSCASDSSLRSPCRSAIFLLSPPIQRPTRQTRGLSGLCPRTTKGQSCRSPSLPLMRHYTSQTPGWIRREPVGDHEWKGTDISSESMIDFGD
jgi:hypothetical protein